jgi:hypothetical protein
MVSGLFRKVQDKYLQQRELGWRGKGHRQQPSTVAAHFQQSLTELTTRLERSVFFNKKAKYIFILFAERSKAVVDDLFFAPSIQV